MLINLAPLRHRNYRLIFIGQLVSAFGSFITFVAIPYQVYEITHSTISVGLISLVELIPLLITSLMGGMLADTFNRKKLLLIWEVASLIGVLLLAWNAHLPQPHLWLLYTLAAFLSACNGLYRPTLEALGLQLIAKEDIPAYGALNSAKGLMGMVGGTAMGGLCLASFGLTITYLIDAATFIISIITVAIIHYVPQPTQSEIKFNINSLFDGFRYAVSRQELLGTYLVDFVAMVFSMPTALFPAIADHFDRPDLIGFLYAAPATGAFIATIFSGWTPKIQRQGLAITLAASGWGISIIAYGYAPTIWAALGFLILAGSADMVSGLFRQAIWNQTIPTELRGRLAGIEMISYNSGPLLGNVQSGFMAALLGTQNAIVVGGGICIAGVACCAALLPKFIHYEPRKEL